jgi:DNA replication protein DnaC
MELLTKLLQNIPNRMSLGEKQAQCPDHGEFTSSGMKYMTNIQVWTKCPDCEDRRISDDRKAEAEKQAKHAREQLESQLEQSAIPARFLSKTFESFNSQGDHQSKALEIVRSYANAFGAHLSKGEGLVLSGLPGTGKSHLAAAVLQSIMPQHVGLYITCLSLIRAVRGTWRKDSEKSETEVLNTLCTVPLLVLDEIGVQYGTDGEQTILFDVLDRRYRDMMPTILLTNQDKKGFKGFIGERSFDRLVETSRWVSFDWPSYRATARSETNPEQDELIAGIERARIRKNNMYPGMI